MALPTSSSNANSVANQTIDPLNSSTIQNNRESENVPKLKSNTSEEYLRWKRYIKWWTNSTKIPKSRWATHIIMHGICDSEVSEKLLDMEDDQLTNQDGLKNITEILDAHFLTHKESKLFNTWTLLRKTEKTNERSMESYIRKVNQIIKDLERQGLKLGDKANAVALISASNLDSNSRLHIESVARNLNHNKDTIKNCLENLWKKPC